MGFEHVWKQKHGFSGPVPFWIDKNKKYFFADSIRGINEIEGLESLDVKKYLRLLEKNKLSSIDAFAVFTLYCLKKWYENRIDSG